VEINLIQQLADRLYYVDGRLINKVTDKPADNYINNWGYRRVSWDRGTAGRVREYAHRLVWFMFNGPVPDGIMIDHIDLDKSNNRLDNLRLITKSGNAQNSKCKGYFWDTRAGKWRAQIKVDGKTKHIGFFVEEQDARAAYIEAKVILHPMASINVLTNN
jgi:hypothetical protein